MVAIVGRPSPMCFKQLRFASVRFDPLQTAANDCSNHSNYLVDTAAEMYTLRTYGVWRFNKSNRGRGNRNKGAKLERA